MPSSVLSSSPLPNGELLLVNLTALQETGDLTKELQALLLRSAVSLGTIQTCPAASSQNLGLSGAAMCQASRALDHDSLADAPSFLAMLSALDILYAAGTLLITGVFVYWSVTIFESTYRATEKRVERTQDRAAAHTLLRHCQRRLGACLAAMSAFYTALLLVAATQLAHARGSTLLTGNMAVAASISASLGVQLLLFAALAGGFCDPMHWVLLGLIHVPAWGSPSEHEGQRAMHRGITWLAVLCSIFGFIPLILYHYYSPFPGLLILACVALLGAAGCVAWRTRRVAHPWLRPTLVMATAAYAVVAGAAAVYLPLPSAGSQLVLLLAAVAAGSAALPMILVRMAMASHTPPEVLTRETLPEWGIPFSGSRMPPASEIRVLLPYWLAQLGLLVSTLRFGTIAAVPFAVAALSHCLSAATASGVGGVALRLGTAAYLTRVLRGSARSPDRMLAALFEELGLGFGGWTHRACVAVLRVMLATVVYAAAHGAVHTALDMAAGQLSMGLAVDGSAAHLQDRERRRWRRRWLYEHTAAVDAAAWDAAGPSSHAPEVLVAAALLWVAALGLARAAGNEWLLGVGGMLYCASLLLFAGVSHLLAGLVVGAASYVTQRLHRPAVAGPGGGGGGVPGPAALSLAGELQAAYRGLPPSLVHGCTLLPHFESQAGRSSGRWHAQLTLGSLVPFGLGDGWWMPYEAVIESAEAAAGSPPRGQGRPCLRHGAALITSTLVFVRYAMAAPAATLAEQGVGGGGSAAAGTALFAGALALVRLAVVEQVGARQAAAPPPMPHPAADRQETAQAAVPPRSPCMHSVILLACSAVLLSQAFEGSAPGDGARALAYAGMAMVYSVVFRVLRQLSHHFSNKAAFYSISLTLVGLLTIQLALVVSTAKRGRGQGGDVWVPLELALWDDGLAAMQRQLGASALPSG